MKILGIESLRAQVGVGGWKFYAVGLFLEGHFLFTCSDTFAAEYNRLATIRAASRTRRQRYDVDSRSYYMHYDQLKLLRYDHGSWKKCDRIYHDVLDRKYA